VEGLAFAGVEGFEQRDQTPLGGSVAAASASRPSVIDWIKAELR
jgi:hypothetical protein